jgi:hypothetical protein
MTDSSTRISQTPGVKIPRKTISLFRITFICSILVVSVSGCGATDADPVAQRNNFDACRIELIANVDSKTNQNTIKINSQAEINCAPLLKLNSQEAKDFSPKPLIIDVSPSKETAAPIKGTQTQKEVITVSFKWGPQTITGGLTQSEAKNYCLNVQSYPLGERVRVVNENNTLIGSGTVQRFSGTQIKSRQVDGEVEKDLTCIYTSELSFKGNSNFYRIAVGSYWWNEFTDTKKLIEWNGKISLDSPDGEDLERAD